MKQEDLETLYGNDPIVKVLDQKGLPITRENWIELNWPTKPNPWTTEHEEEIPTILQNK